MVAALITGDSNAPRYVAFVIIAVCIFGIDILKTLKLYYRDVDRKLPTPLQKIDNGLKKFVDCFKGWVN